MKREFPLATVLSVLHGRLFTDNTDSVIELLAYLNGASVKHKTSAALLRELKAVQPFVRQQPQLKRLALQTRPPRRLRTDEDIKTWVQTLEGRHGQTVKVAPAVPMRQKRAKDNIGIRIK